MVLGVWYPTDVKSARFQSQLEVSHESNHTDTTQSVCGWYEELSAATYAKMHSSTHELSTLVADSIYVNIYQKITSLRLRMTLH